MRRRCKAAQHFLGPDTRAQRLDSHGPGSSEHASSFSAPTDSSLDAVPDNRPPLFGSIQSLCRRLHTFFVDVSRAIAPVEHRLLT